MAELYQAYGFSENESFAPKNDYYEDRHDTERPMYKEPGHQPSQHVQEYSQSIPQIQQPQLAPQPVQMQQSQQVAHQGHQGHQGSNQGNQGNQGNQASRRYPSYSFSDRMAMKRSEVIKLAIFSLVIVLAISIDRLGTHYLSKYLSDNIFTDIQEFMLRLSYPILVFLLLWIIKSL